MNDAKAALLPPRKETPRRYRNSEAVRPANSARSPQNGGAQRVWDRFKVPNTVAICERRAALVMWKPCAPPGEVMDLGMAGLGLRLVGCVLNEGETVRLTLHIPGQLPVKVKGEVARVQELPGGRAHVYGIQFTDYDTRAWGMLCELHRQHGASAPPRARPPASSEPPTEIMAQAL